MLALSLAGCGGGTASSPSTVTKTVYGSSATQATASATETPAPMAEVTPQPTTPNYTIVAKTPDEFRFDHKANYYIAIDPVDPSNDSFKQNVKLVLQAVEKNNGDPNFSSNVYDDEAVAKTAFSYKSDPTGVTPSEINAQEEHDLVAMYTGGINTDAKASTADDAYNIEWYPAAFPDSPNVGKYVSGEQWKP